MAKVETWEAQGNRHIDVASGASAMPYHELVAALALKYTKADDRVLDLGCGLGQTSFLIHTGGARRVSIADAYEVCLEKAAERIRVDGRFLIGERQFDVSSAVPGEYDAVVMSHVLEHLLDPVGAVRDTLSLVRPGGHLILAVPNPARPGVFLGNLFQVHYVNRGHVVSWDPSHWRNFLENVLGLDVVEYSHDFVRLKGCNRFRPLLRVGKLLGRVFPWWCFSNVAVIRRPPAGSP